MHTGHSNKRARSQFGHVDAVAGKVLVVIACPHPCVSRAGKHRWEPAPPTSKCEEEDKAKLRFTEQAVLGPDPFVLPELHDGELLNAVDWIAKRSPAEVNAYRLEVTANIEQLASTLRDAGTCSAWFEGADCHVAQARHLCPRVLRHTCLQFALLFRYARQ